LLTLAMIRLKKLFYGIVGWVAELAWASLWERRTLSDQRWSDLLLASNGAGMRRSGRVGGHEV